MMNVIDGKMSLKIAKYFYNKILYVCKTFQHNFPCISDVSRTVLLKINSVESDLCMCRTSNRENLELLATLCIFQN